MSLNKFSVRICEKPNKEKKRERERGREGGRDGGNDLGRFSVEIVFK